MQACSKENEGIDNNNTLAIINDSDGCSGNDVGAIKRINYFDLTVGKFAADDVNMELSTSNKVTQ